MISRFQTFAFNFNLRPYTMARGRLTLHQHVPSAALEGLEEFSHVWLIYVFHANTDLQQSLGDRKRSTARWGGAG